MNRLTLDLPEPVLEALRRLAQREHLSAEQFLSRMVAEAVRLDEAWDERVRRGRQVTRERFLEILATAPDVPPIPGDELP
jgi:hypothetical protein